MANIQDAIQEFMNSVNPEILQQHQQKLGEVKKISDPVALRNGLLEWRTSFLGLYSPLSSMSNTDINQALALKHPGFDTILLKYYDLQNSSEDAAKQLVSDVMGSVFEKKEKLLQSQSQPIPLAEINGIVQDFDTLYSETLDFVNSFNFKITEQAMPPVMEKYNQEKKEISQQDATLLDLVRQYSSTAPAAKESLVELKKKAARLQEDYKAARKSAPGCSHIGALKAKALETEAENFAKLDLQQMRQQLEDSVEQLSKCSFFLSKQEGSIDENSIEALELASGARDEFKSGMANWQNFFYTAGALKANEGIVQDFETKYTSLLQKATGTYEGEIKGIEGKLKSFDFSDEKRLKAISDEFSRTNARYGLAASGSARQNIEAQIETAENKIVQIGADTSKIIAQAKTLDGKLAEIALGTISPADISYFRELMRYDALAGKATSGIIAKRNEAAQKFNAAVARIPSVVRDGIFAVEMQYLAGNYGIPANFFATVESIATATGSGEMLSQPVAGLKAIIAYNEGTLKPKEGRIQAIRQQVDKIFSNNYSLSNETARKSLSADLENLSKLKEELQGIATAAYETGEAKLSPLVESLRSSAKSAIGYLGSQCAAEAKNMEDASAAAKARYAALKSDNSAAGNKREMIDIYCKVEAMKEVSQQMRQIGG